MGDSTRKTEGAQPPQPPHDHRGHVQPRRSTPETSVTLRRHPVPRDALGRAAPMGGVAAVPVDSPRRDSSGESHDTSDPRGWFDRSNRNLPAATFEATAMDVDPPFFQKETDSSNGETRDPRVDPAYPFGPGARQVLMRPAITHSSSNDDYRSVIDDLTIENKRLKEELKRYKQFGPDMMRKEKLFEIKVHGLPKRKKRELEATLRNFAASLEGSSESPPQRKKQGRHGTNQYSSGGSMSKHASSSSSRSRPVDSAYASMSTGPSSNAPNSSKASLGRPYMTNRVRTSEQKVEDYLRDTPGGLFPRPDELTDKERKKLVVRRLEQLFTGKIGGRTAQRTQHRASAESKSASDTALVMAPPNAEATREARIQPNDPSRKKPRSGDNLSTSNSNGDRTESGGNGQGSGDGGGSGGGSGGRTGNNTSPPSAPPPEQRPTRPKDLDPDRVQVPAENMEYIRHLGLVAPDLMVDGELCQQKVSPDAEGWVYLNLLCNLAQLHMLNVTPNFIRAAVTEKSTKFQLSPDGRKIRWRGGTDGTKFSSDSSGDNSQKSPSTDETDGSNGNGPRKRAKVHVAGVGTKSSTSTRERKSAAQASTSSDSFHYKPMFVQQSSSVETSLEGTGSQGSDGMPDDSNQGNSKWDYSGSGSSQRKKRRHDGAIVYYSGAPFCIDLSGDPGDISPTTYMTSTGQELESVNDMKRVVVHRTLSGSSLPIRPLSDPKEIVSEVLDFDLHTPPDIPDLLDDDESTSNEEFGDFPWCDHPEEFQTPPMGPSLETCGLGGVLPEDHFVVIVDTRRTIGRGGRALGYSRSRSVESAEAISTRLASMSTSSPHPTRGVGGLDKPIQIEYLRAKTQGLKPHPLPPPAIFIPPFSTDSETEGSEDECDSEFEEDAQGNMISPSLISRQANPHLSEDSEVGGNILMGSGGVEPGRVAAVEESDSSIKSLQPQAAQSAVTGRRSESSVATRGAESGYSSSLEDE